MCIVPKKEIPILSHLGRSTMQIYFWHIPIRSILFVTGIHVAASSYGYIGKLFWEMMSMTITIALSLKIFSFPTTNILKGIN